MKTNMTFILLKIGKNQKLTKNRHEIVFYIWNEKNFNARTLLSFRVIIYDRHYSHTYKYTFSRVIIHN